VANRQHRSELTFEFVVGCQHEETSLCGWSHRTSGGTGHVVGRGL